MSDQLPFVLFRDAVFSARLAVFDLLSIWTSARINPKGLPQPLLGEPITEIQKQLADGHDHNKLLTLAEGAQDTVSEVKARIRELLDAGIAAETLAPNGGDPRRWLVELLNTLDEITQRHNASDVATYVPAHGTGSTDIPYWTRLYDRLLEAETHLENMASVWASADRRVATAYLEILAIIHATGLEIERHPKVYKGKGEEALRDHLLMALSSHFQSVTGETFNKAGKTDILVRQDGKNLFVAECVVWNGPKKLLGKIDQLLSYLTWRDSNTALVCFVRKKEIAAVIAAVKKGSSRSFGEHFEGLIQR